MKIPESGIYCFKNACDYRKLNRLDFLNIDAADFFMKTKQWDVCYYHKFPFNILCNFSPANFKFDNCQINSMEGFIQSLKTPNIEEQKSICSLYGHMAKKIGNYYKSNGFFDRTSLYWNGKQYNRYSEEYKKLLEIVYEVRYLSNTEFQDVLQSTNGYKLTHKIGKADKNDTILTEEEFIEQLNILRNKHNTRTQKIPASDILKKYQNRDKICHSVGDLEKLGIKDLCLINDSRVVGSPILNTEYKQYLYKIRESGIDTIINLDINADNMHNTELCKRYGLNYFNLPITSENNLIKKEDINKLLDLMSNHKVYIESKDITQTDTNIILALNYLLKKNAQITDSVLVNNAYEYQQFTDRLDKIINNIANKSDTHIKEKLNILKLVNCN